MPIVLAGIAAALVGMLLLFALSPILRSIAAALAELPLNLGGWLAGNMVRLESAVFIAMAGWADAALAPLNMLFQHAAVWGLSQLNASVSGLQEAANAVWRVRNYAIPAALQTAENYASQLFGQLYSIMLDQLASVRSLAYQLYNAAVALADYLYGQATNFALQLYQAAVALADYYLRFALARIEQVLAQLLEYVNQAIALETAYVQALSATDRAYTDATGATVSAYARALTLEAENLAEQIGLSDRAYTDSSSAYVAAAAAAATSAVLTRVRTIEQSRCMRQCDALGLLGEELGEIDLLALIALIAAANRDPRGTAGVVKDYLGPVVGLGRELAHGLYGR